MNTSAMEHRAPATVPVARATQFSPRQPIAWAFVAPVLVAKLALHMVTLAVTQFGIQRDEFLYMAMGQHLRLWRMDFPPLIGILANVSRALFGHSLAVVRVFPAIEGCMLILVAVLIAREMGGGRIAQALTALCMLGNTLFGRASTLFQPVVLDQLWWTLALYALVRLARERRARWWLTLGVCLGIGLMTKFSILFVSFGIFVGILATPVRRWLLTPWPWAAAAIALTLGSPSIVGQIALGFPVIGQMHDLQGQQLSHVSWSSFLGGQPLMAGPVPFAIAVLGAWALLAWQPLRAFAVVGWACLATFILLFVLHGKAYYIGPVYPTLFAAGSTTLERMQSARWRAPSSAIAAAGILAFGLLRVPIAVPILSPEHTAAYAVRTGAAQSLLSNQGAMDRLPQDFADMIGWEEQSRALARVVAGLPETERERAVIFAGNYGEAGAAEFYGPRYGLAPVVSAAGSYWFFGPGARAGDVVITIGADSADVAKAYRDVQRAGTILSPWSVEEERAVPLLVARNPKQTLQRLWPTLAGSN